MIINMETKTQLVMVFTNWSLTGSSMYSLVARMVYRIYHTTAAVPAPLWQPP